MRSFPAALCALGVLTTTLTGQPTAPRLQGIIGRWGPFADSEPALQTDGAAWDGKVSRDDLTAAGKALFGDASAAFLANASSRTAFPLAVDVTTRDFRQGTLRVQFQLISGSDDRSGGIVFGLGASGEYRYVRYNTKDGNLALWAFRNGDRAVLAKGEGLKQLPTGAWHELVVRVQGQQVHATVTGHPELDARFSLEAPVEGRVGLWAKRDVVTAFRRFGVEASHH
jgi:hypothetical protein